MADVYPTHRPRHARQKSKKKSSGSARPPRHDGGNNHSGSERARAIPSSTPSATVEARHLNQPSEPAAAADANQPADEIRGASSKSADLGTPLQASTDASRRRLRSDSEELRQSWRELLDSADALRRKIALEDAVRQQAIASLEIQAVQSGCPAAQVRKFLADIHLLLPSAISAGPAHAHAHALENDPSLAVVDQLLDIEDEITRASAHRKELEDYLAIMCQQDVQTKRSAREESALKIMTRRVTEIELQHQKLLGDFKQRHVHNQRRMHRAGHAV